MTVVQILITDHQQEVRNGFVCARDQGMQRKPC